MTGNEDAQPFGPADYAERLADLRDLMEVQGLDALVLSSPGALAHLTGLLPDAARWARAAVVTAERLVVVRGAQDPGTLWHGEDEGPGGAGLAAQWRAIAALTGTGRRIGCEAGHLTMVEGDALNHFLQPLRGADVTEGAAMLRCVLSPAERALVARLAGAADAGMAAMRAAWHDGFAPQELAAAGQAAVRALMPGVADAGVRVRAGSAGPGLTLTVEPSCAGYHAALRRAVGGVDAERLSDARGQMLAVLGAGETLGAVAESVAGQSATLQATGGVMGITDAPFAPVEGAVLAPGVALVPEAGMVLALGLGVNGHIALADTVLMTDAGPVLLTRASCD